MSKATKITYWITTVLFAGMMTMSAMMQLSQAKPIVESVKNLGLPLHLTFLLGTLKALGVVALVLPGFPKIREWAYAGFTFLLMGATYVHFAVGDYEPITLILLAVLFTSYFTGQRLTSLKTKRVSSLA
jgi:hypothetical protein